MIGGASPILALPPTGVPGGLAPPQATGDGPVAGFGAVIGVLGAALVAIGDAAAQGAITAEGGAPPAKSETADVPDVDGILDAMTATTDVAAKPLPDVIGTATGEGVSPSSTGKETLSAPLATLKPATDDATAAPKDIATAGNAQPRLPLAGRIAAMARVNRPVGEPAVATPVVGEGDPAPSPASSGKSRTKKAEPHDDVAVASVSPTTPSTVPVAVATISPNGGAPAVAARNGAAMERGPARSAQFPVAPTPASDEATGDMPATAAPLPPTGGILPSGGGDEGVATDLPPLPGGATDVAAAELPDAPHAPVDPVDQPPAPKLTAQPESGPMAMPTIPAPANPIRAIPAREAAPSAQAALPPVDGAETSDAATPTTAAATALQQPAPPQLVPAAAQPLANPAPAAPVSPTIDMAQVAMGHHLDLARDSAWLDQLARDIVATAAGDSQLRFKLNPEHLGSLHVELLRHDDGAAVRMTTESEAARAVLADAQGRLVAEARAHGMRITETSVDLSRGGNGGGDGGQRGWGDAQSGQSGQPNPQPRQRNVNASVTMSAVNGDRIEARPARRDLYA